MRPKTVGEENPSNLPAGYTIDLVGDPCVIVLLRGDRSVVARFTRNVDPQEVRRAAEEDSRSSRSPSHYERRRDTQRS